MTSLCVCLALCCAAAEGDADAALEVPKLGSFVIVLADDPAKHLFDWSLPKDEPQADGPLTEEQGRRIFKVRLSDEAAVKNGPAAKADAAEEPPPLFGSYAVREGRIEFRPKFALTRGVIYTGTLYSQKRKAADGTPLVLERIRFKVPLLKTETPPRVDVVLPSAEIVPANILKFGIVFTKPMREGKEVFSHIHLFDSQGREIAAPWRDIELWHREIPLLTLYIHPGRIKQGVNLREELGPVLKPDEDYELVIDGAMRDVDGLPLGKDFKHRFRTSAEVRKKLDPSKWKFHLPDRLTRDELVVEFDRRVDSWSSYPNFDPLKIVDASGKTVAAIAGSGGLRISYRPKKDQVWDDGKYRIIIDRSLTDLAGNTPYTVFDRDLDDRAHDPTEGPIERTFTIR